MIVIGIDPGTSCGWSVLQRVPGVPVYDQALLDSGTWDLRAAETAGSGSGARFLEVRTRLLDLIRDYEERDPAGLVVFYERPGMLKGDAILLLNGIVAIVECTCEGRKVSYGEVSPGEVKRAAGVPGNADKAAVMASIGQRFPHGAGMRDNNEADAIAVALAGMLQVE